MLLTRSHETDVLAGHRLVREIGEASTLVGRRYSEAVGGDGVDDVAALHTYVKNNYSAYVIWWDHARPVTPRCRSWTKDSRVYGVECLRVANGSVMRPTPSSNTNITVDAIVKGACVVIGERAAGNQKADHGI